MTSAEEAITVSWPESLAIARAADEAGFEAIVPVARWKGFKGDTDFNHRSFETLSWAAGLAAATRNITVFATTHISTIHPVRAAKEIATIDHISGGRFALNVVAGWNSAEMAMFGAPLREHDERYALAEEWLELVKKLWTSTEEFDFEGKYFQAKGAYSSPRPIQSPYPVLMNAGSSARGREFAIKNVDLLFIVTPDLETTRQTVSEVKEKARLANRDTKVFWFGHIVCRDTVEEAQRYYDYYVQEKGDWNGVRNLLEELIPNSEAMSPADRERMAENMVAGYGGWPLIGTPEMVAEGLQQMADTGIDGLVLSWVDYKEGIEQFQKEIHPLLVDLGLRTDGI